ncbi:MAG: alpha hydrolase, partial [Methanosarcinaceae archaeon]|nr:alpha hydrolase [Methanosarcinaceae archaeon]
VAKSARELNFPHRMLCLEREILESAYEMILKDGFPKNAINHIHKKALETLASESDMQFLADGTRRDDRVPMLDLSQIRSLEDRFGVRYICPLKGYGRNTVDRLVERHLLIEEGLSENTLKADYETELREVIRQRIGEDKIHELFPVHVQSHVLSRKMLR